MEIEIFTPGNITFILGLLGVIFTVYNYFKNPQIDQDKRDALLAQQVQWQNEGTERRFKEIQDNFNGLLLQNNNHIHTMCIKVDKVCENVNAMAKEITKLATIIEERIPKK